MAHLVLDNKLLWAVIGLVGLYFFVPFGPWTFLADLVGAPIAPLVGLIGGQWVAAFGVIGATWVALELRWRRHKH